MFGTLRPENAPVRFLVPLALVAACSSGPPRQSGFLEDYSKLRPYEEHQNILVWQAPDADFSRYNKVLLEPVQVVLTKAAQDRALPGEEIHRLAGYFEAQLREKLKGGYPLVREPGPDVLRLRTALTDLNPVDPKTALVSRVTVKVNLDPGGGSMEAELRDSQTNRLLLAAAVAKESSQIPNAGDFKRWAHAQEALEFAAQRIRDFLDRAHGKQPSDG